MFDKNFSSKIMLLSIILAAFLIVVILPFSMTGKGRTASETDDIETRIAPVAKVEMQASVGTTSGAKDGKTVFGMVCSACHGAGVMGAPKFGDKAAWAPRIAQGLPTLYSHAINGYKTMPARGGSPSLSDDEVKAGVQYMVDATK